MKIQSVIATSVIGLLVDSTAFAATEVFLGDSSGGAEAVLNVPVTFYSDEKIVGVQFDVVTEAGAGSITGISPGPGSVYSNHTIETEVLSSGNLRVLVSSMSNAGLKPGDVANIGVVLAVPIPESGRAIALTNVVLATAAGEKAAHEVVPKLRITAPARGGFSSVGTVIPVGAMASASLASESITQVEFFADGASIGTAAAAPYGLTWTPLEAGSYVLTAVATKSGGGQFVSPGVAVHVDVPTGWAGWRMRQFSPSQLLLEDVSGEGANPDGDRWLNFAEFGFGTNALAHDAAPVQSDIFQDAASGERYLTVTYQRSILATDVDFTVQKSTDLAHWAAVETPFIEWLVVPDGEVEHVTLLDPEPIGSAGPKKMVRVAMNQAVVIGPDLEITRPVAGTLAPLGVALSIEAGPLDAEGYGDLTQVEFFANGTSIGTAGAAPFTVSWTPTNAGNVLLTGVATGNSESIDLPAVAVHAGVGSAFEGWQFDTFDATQRADADVSGKTANPDADRLDNWGEWVFGTNPLVSDSVPVWIELSTDSSGGQTYYEVTYQRSVFASGVDFKIEESGDLSVWTPADASLMPWATELRDEVEWVTFRSKSPLDGAPPRKLFRVIASAP